MKTRSRISLYKSVSRPSRTSRPVVHSETRKNSIYNIHIYKYIMYTHSQTHTVTESSLNCCLSFLLMFSEQTFFTSKVNWRVSPRLSDRVDSTCHHVWYLSELLYKAELFSLIIWSVFNKLCVRSVVFLYFCTPSSCSKSPKLAFKHPSMFVQLCGERRNKLTHSKSLGQLRLQMTSQCNGSFC